MAKEYSPISTQDSQGTYHEESQVIYSKYYNNDSLEIDFKRVIPETKKNSINLLQQIKLPKEIILF